VSGESRTAPSFPFGSLLLFIAGAVCLRLLTMTGWFFFPGTGVGPQIARIVIPLGFSVALVVFNQRMLARDGFPRDDLGLRPTLARAGGLLGGVAAMTLILVAMAAVLWLMMPFHYERGALSCGGFSLRALEYFVGNTGEELIFRGYLLLLLHRHCGLGWALAISGLLFGLFHLPGLSGVVALKMVCTTFIGGSLFACGFLLTGTLWTAIGMHVAGNLVLHHVLGLSGNPASLFTPVFDRAWPTTYDPAFFVWLVIPIPILAAVIWRYRHQPMQTH
jgi:membrane protease YdiL (CAAX protease family)